jgi:histone H3/H4
MYEKGGYNMSELLVVGSKVRAVIKKGKMNMAGDFAKGLSEKLHWKITRAMERAKSNGRKTVRAKDL